MAVNCAINVVAKSLRLLQLSFSLFVAAQSMFRKESDACACVLASFSFHQPMGWPAEFLGSTVCFDSSVAERKMQPSGDKC